MANTAKAKTANCRRCRGLLTSARAVARGYGDRCWTLKRREDAVKAAGYKPHQVASARELIEDGAIVPHSEPGRFIVVSSDGSEFYETTADTCGCPAFENGRHCYHRCAVLLVGGTAPKAEAPKEDAEEDERTAWIRGLIAEAEAYEPAPAREAEVLIPVPAETARLAGTNVLSVAIAPDGMAVYQLAEAVL